MKSIQVLALGLLISRPVLAGPFQGMVYDLDMQSTLTDDCLFCDRPAIVEGLRGTFVLTRLPVRVQGEMYSMTEIDFLDLNRVPGCRHIITGSGTYYRNEVITTLSLDVMVKNYLGVALASGEVKPAAEWPDIDITVTEDGQRDPSHVYTLRIIARPSGPATESFRRGDSNDDGTVDISDALDILSWAFLGGIEPTCLDAADVDDEGAIDLTDAVYLLNHLFLGGPDLPNPTPGCGPDPTEDEVGCGSSQSCG